MFAVVMRFQFQRPPNGDLQRTLEDIADQLGHFPGFYAHYGFFPTATEAVTTHVWESQLAAEQALQKVGPTLQQVIVPQHGFQFAQAAGETVRTVLGAQGGPRPVHSSGAAQGPLHRRAIHAVGQCQRRPLRQAGDHEV